MVFAAGQFLNADQLNTATTAIMARGNRQTSSSTTTTTVGVLRIDNISLKSGRLYRICVNGINMISTVNNDDVQAKITYKTGGSAAGTGDTVLPGSYLRGRYVSSTGSEIKPIQAIYSAGSDQTISFLLCITRAAGTGSVSIFGDNAGNQIDMWVEDIGVDPGDSGTDI